METKSRPTLELVALRANVSKATASKVLNNRGDVAAGTRKRVREAAAALQYTARGPSTRTKTAAVAIVVETLRSRYAAELIQGALAAAAPAGTLVAVSTLQTDSPGTHDEPLSKPWLRDLAARGYSALVVVSLPITPSQADLCESLGIALVTVDPRGSWPEAVPSVGATNWAGGVQATEHLIELEHRRIAYAGGPETSRPAQERLHGYRSAMSDGGIPIEPALVQRVGFTYEAGFTMGSVLLDQPEPPTAIVCGSDPAAIGVLEAARIRRVRVPEHLSLVGFDDSQVAAWASPRLTTVRQPLAEMGAAALRTAVNLATGTPHIEGPVQLATNLVVRDSTAPLRG